MRAALSGVLAASLAFGPAWASTGGTVCARPAEKAAFDIVSLKSQLMVTALSCSVQDRYNAFVMRYRMSLVAQERALTVYFGRAFGRRGQAQHDDYVTSLANAQSEEGTKLGTDFCRQNVTMFDEVMALPSPKELPAYAAGKPLVQPIAVVSCPVAIRTATHVTHHVKRKTALHS